MRKTTRSICSICLAVLLLAAGCPSKKGTTVGTQPTESQSQTQQVAALAANAFGSLSNTQNGQNVPLGATEATKSSNSSMMASGAASAVAPSPSGSAPSNVLRAESSFAATDAVVGNGVAMSARATAVKMPAVDPSIMPVYESTTYKYVYKGDKLAVTENMMDVYRRKTGGSLLNATADLLNKLGLGQINIGSFSSLKLQDVTLVEDKDDGYMVTANLGQGMLSLYENWERKTNRPDLCKGDTCKPWEPLPESQAPSDDEILKASDAFLKDHGINTSLYGAPSIDHSWKVYARMDATASSMPIMAPESVTVTYPYQLDGKIVESTYGAPIGMSVSVGLRDKRVTSVWGIAVQQFEKSSYETEKDLKRISSFIERGGIYGWTDPNATKVEEIELGDPRISLTSIGRMNGEKWEELYVPAFVFPVLKKPVETPWMQDAVVVPMIKDLLQEPEIPQPVPMMKAGSAGGGVAEPAGTLEVKP